ncbi:MAG: hypothetical protein IPG45_02000 [Deltaproteobacteria bacterium]|jgi:enolase|nr:hypothetical protein [Deltaproteobacteria bacterium]
MKILIASLALAATAPLTVNTPALQAEPATAVASTVGTNPHPFGPMAVVFVRLAFAAAAASSTKSNLPSYFEGPAPTQAFD